MNSSNFKTIPIDAIQVGDDRRQLNHYWVEVLAESIAEQGLINPISVWPVGGGAGDESEATNGGKNNDYKLKTGHHRLAAFKLLEREHIPAHIREFKPENGSYIKLEEVTENLIRNELAALDRAQAMFDLDAFYKGLYPELKQGGDRKSEDAQNQTAIVAVWSELLEKVGMSERSFRRAKAIWKGLSKASIARIYGTWLADHQASLMQLAGVGPKEQTLVLDILFAENPKATSVAEALIIVHGKRLVPTSEKRIASTQSNLVAMNRQERISVLSSFKDEILEIAQMNGWLDA